MSFQAAVSQLKSPLKELLVAVTENGTQHVGITDKDQAEIVEWIERTGQSDIASKGNIQNFDSLLLPRTYLVGNYLTAADVALYGALHPFFSKLQPLQYYGYPSLTRHFNHIQSSSLVRGSADTLSPSFNLVAFDFENAPTPERKAEPPKKKEKKPVVEVEDAKVEGAVAAPSAENPSKKEKKEKKKDVPAGPGKKAATGGKAAPTEEGEPIPSMIDLRVGRIVDIKKHPDADSLYVEQIDIGEETGPRTVVSGLVNFIPIEEMRDKYLVAVCNLKPANMRGVKSFAMVLCASLKGSDKTTIELIQPPANSKPGDRVYFEGAEFENGTPLSQLNPKKKIFETVQPGFITLESREAAWVNPISKSIHKIRTKDGVCLAPTLVGASLS